MLWKMRRPTSDQTAAMYGIGVFFMSAMGDLVMYTDIFERYSKKEEPNGSQDTGTGLGLYICKHIVEQHGGKIWIESKEGIGTSVFFTLPSA